MLCCLIGGLPRSKTTFEKETNNFDCGYDIIYDWQLIIDSYMYTYHEYLLKIPDKDMKWSEFITRIAGFDKDSPLIAVIRIRLEKNKDIIKNFNESQKRIYNDWQKRRQERLKESPYYEEHMKKQNMMIMNMFEAMANEK